MAIRHPHRFLPLVVITLLSSFGCGDGTGIQTAIGPSGVFTTGASQTIVVQPSFITPQRVFGGFCPAEPPFMAPLNVVFSGSHPADLFLNRVQIQFADGFVMFGTPLVLTRTDLLSRFGTVTVPAFGARTFPFSFPFGCGGIGTSTLIVGVSVIDRLGREDTTTVRVGLRNF